MTFDPGRMRERVLFEPPAAQTEDDLGVVEGNGFDAARGVARAAVYLMRPGSEATIDARMAGVQPIDVVVRRDSATRAIGPDWRMTDLATGVVYAVAAPPADMDRSRQWLTILVKTGEVP